jgi:hypothetical protein
MIPTRHQPNKFDYVQGNIWISNDKKHDLKEILFSASKKFMANAQVQPFHVQSEDSIHVVRLRFKLIEKQYQ